MDDTLVTELMTTPVLTVERDEKPGDVARAMVDTEIKSVVVIDESCAPIGILTSTDYVAMTANGTNPHETTVSDHMTSNVITAMPDDTIGAVTDRMVDNDISHVPVVEDGVVGIVTQTDLAEYLVEEL